MSVKAIMTCDICGNEIVRPENYSVFSIERWKDKPEDREKGHEKTTCHIHDSLEHPCTAKLINLFTLSLFKNDTSEENESDENLRMSV
jgi:hypothetical protein